jgi:hypothetical protein
MQSPEYPELIAVHLAVVEVDDDLAGGGVPWAAI